MMKTIVPTMFAVSAAIGIGANASAQSVSPEPAIEQLAFTALYPCGGGCDQSSYPTSESVLMDIDGTQLITLTSGDGSQVPVANGMWSPDGTRLLVGGADISMISVVGGASVNLTNHRAWYGFPAWSPDGARIAFASDRDGSTGLYIMKADGSDVMRIATDVSQYASGPTWSPDSTRLAFTCITDSTTRNSDICAINVDGSGFARLTDDPAGDYQPDWSPDGATIVFTTTRYTYSELAVMRPDGSNVTRLSPDLYASSPSWSADGRRIAFVHHLPWDPDQPWLIDRYVAIMNADGTGFATVAAGYGPVWRPWTGAFNYRPVASFTFQCSGATCTFDGSGSWDSDGSIRAYGWQFEDGTASGPVVTHTFTGGHNVGLIVMDDRGALSTVIQNVNQLPVVSFTTTCSGLTCTFDASASYDPDGAIAFFVWKFGDLKDGGGASKMTHTYATGGTYIVSVSATDQDWGTTTYSQVVTLKDDLHIGDLDGSTRSRGNTWTAIVTITVHDAAHAAVANAVVNGSWDDGIAVQCTTDATGHCSVVNRITSKNTTGVRFTVTDVVLVMFAYRPAANHDSDDDSNGTTISVTR